tara:strand:- start:677 stop:910 length:234 start_codon:yes stop_codon:yes gene_type:complete
MGNEATISQEIPSKRSYRGGKKSGQTTSAPGRRPVRKVLRATTVIGALSLLYFGVLGGLMQQIDARTDFVPPNLFAV